MTTMTYSNLPMGATFTVSNSNEVFAKHSESLALCADGTKIRVTQPTRALVNQIDIRDVKAEQPTYVDSIHAETAEKIGLKVRRELRAHLRKPFGDRGIKIMVEWAVAAAHEGRIAIGDRNE